MEEPLVTQPETITSSVKVESTVTPSIIKESWLHVNIRNLVLVGLLVVVCYLAFRGIEAAIAAVLATFSTLAGSTWGSRDALKRPGVDN